MAKYFLLFLIASLLFMSAAATSSMTESGQLPPLNLWNRKLLAAISDTDLVLYTLTGLSAEYEAFITTVTTFKTLPTFPEIFDMLISQENHRKILSPSLDMSQETKTVAMVAHRTDNRENAYARGRGDRNGRGRNNYNSYNSSGRGNFGSYNGGRGNFGSYNGGRGNNRGRGYVGGHGNTSNYKMSAAVTCQYCGRKGHNARQCYDIPKAFMAMALNTGTTNNGASSSTSSPNVMDNNQEWYPDTGATHHMMNCDQSMEGKSPYYGCNSVIFGSGDKLSIRSIGNMSLPSMHENFRLKNVLHVPMIHKNLLSVAKFTRDNGCKMEFTPHDFSVKNMQTGEIMHQGRLKDGLYAWTNTSTAAEKQPTGKKMQTCNAYVSSFNNDVPRDTFKLWHERLGHANDSLLNRMNSSKYIASDFMPKEHFCSVCALAKMHRLPFDSTELKTSSPLELLHADVWGSSPCMSREGYKYYLIIVDDFSRFTWIFMLTKKSETFSCFQNFHKIIEKQLEHKIKVFHSDCGGEFMSTEFSMYLASHGIQRRLSCPYTPQQNGIAERKHRHIVEMGLTMLINACMPAYFWTDAFRMAVYIINRLPISTQECTPFETLLGTKPQLENLKVFGCTAYPLVSPQTKSKLAPKSHACVFLGFPKCFKGYICYNPMNKRVTISRHVIFDENTFLYSGTRPPTTAQEIISWLAKDASQITTGSQLIHLPNPSTPNLSSLSNLSPNHHISQQTTTDFSLPITQDEPNPTSLLPETTRHVRNHHMIT
ncbi:Retrovirus-related Pol polyprotein from transposon TNT 1-94 [Nymphaea thermarum]|nr:Retrovirus-related Pol polyprotein from transposon TNT 1-94 [Nymphaea thermarum]